MPDYVDVPTRVQFDAMLARVDNSSRWGPQDERGTLNFITPDVRRAAATVVATATVMAMVTIVNQARCLRTACVTSKSPSGQPGGFFFPVFPSPPANER